MKHIFFGVIIFIIVLMFSFNYKTLKLDNDIINVSVVYKNENIEYELKPYSLLEEILEDYEDIDTRKINPKQILHHNDVIVLPVKGNNTCISINSNVRDELMLIPGIGPITAENIISYRNEYGVFQKLEDIMLVKGIGQSKFEKMKDYICL